MKLTFDQSKKCVLVLDKTLKGNQLVCDLINERFFPDQALGLYILSAFFRSIYNKILIIQLVKTHIIFVEYKLINLLLCKNTFSKVVQWLEFIVLTNAARVISQSESFLKLFFVQYIMFIKLVSFSVKNIFISYLFRNY